MDCTYKTDEVTRNTKSNFGKEVSCLQATEMENIIRTYFRERDCSTERETNGCGSGLWLTVDYNVSGGQVAGWPVRVSEERRMHKHVLLVLKMKTLCNLSTEFHSPLRLIKLRESVLECKANSLLYCTLASCYIRFTLNICSFVQQCNLHFLLFIIRRHVSASHGHLQVL
jgi:hypothetical protein